MVLISALLHYRITLTARMAIVLRSVTITNWYLPYSGSKDAMTKWLYGKSPTTTSANPKKNRNVKVGGDAWSLGADGYTNGFGLV